MLCFTEPHPHPQTGARTHPDAALRLRSRRAGTAAVLGDLTKVYQRIVTDQEVLNLGGESSKESHRVMDDPPQFRNTQLQSAASLAGWEQFDFYVKFAPIRHAFMNYLHALPTTEQALISACTRVLR